MKLLKKTVVISLIALLMIILANTKAFASTKGKILEGLNLREEASTDSKILLAMDKGDALEVLEQTGDWYKVTYKEKTGYAAKQYIEVEGEIPNAQEEEQQENLPEQEPQEEKQPEGEEQQPQQNEEVPTQTEEIKPFVIQDKQLITDSKIYLVPLINSTVIGDLKKDDTVKVIQVLNDWAYIVKDNLPLGWILNSTLEEKQGEEQPNQPTEDLDNGTETPDAPVSVDKTGYINTDGVNLREEASTSSDVIKSLGLNTELTIIEETGDWYKVKVGDIEGYVASRLVSDKKTEETNRSLEEDRPEVTVREMYTSVNVANVREEASTSSKVVSKLYKKDKVEVIGEENNFYKIKLNDTYAYVSKDLLVDSLDKIIEETPPSNNSNSGSGDNNNPTSGSSTGADIVATAKKYLGYKYVYGGESPSRGFDCSGYTKYIFSLYGVSLSHSATAQSKVGSYVAKSDLQLGDLVIFNDDANYEIGHVGIYIGGNNFIHASNPSDGVKITSLSTSYYSARYVTARRVI